MNTPADLAGRRKLTVAWAPPQVASRNLASDVLRRTWLACGREHVAHCLVQKFVNHRCVYSRVQYMERRVSQMANWMAVGVVRLDLRGLWTGSPRTGVEPDLRDGPSASSGQAHYERGGQRLGGFGQDWLPGVAWVRFRGGLLLGPGPIRQAQGRLDAGMTEEEEDGRVGDAATGKGRVERGEELERTGNRRPIGDAAPTRELMRRGGG